MISREEAAARITAPGAPFEIAVEDVRGEQLPVFARRPRFLGEWLRDSLRHGDAEYLVWDGGRMTFAEHHASAAALASALRSEYGVGKGDRVAICAANRPEWIVVFWATVSLGAIAVGMNSMWAAPELAHGLSLTEPKVIVADAPRRVLLPASGTPVISIEEDLQPLIARHAGTSLPSVPVDEDDPAVILFTSGTAGRAKGATHSHRNVIAAVQYALFGDALAAEMGFPPAAGRRFLLISPLFHIASLHNLAVSRIVTGETAVIYSGRFEISRVLSLIERERVTQWGAMPTMLTRLVSFDGLSKYDLSSLRSISVNSAPSSEELKARVREVLPGAAQSLFTTYGLTESSTAATFATPADLAADPSTVGSAVVNMQVSIHDPVSGAEVPDGVEGEIWLRGAQMMLGYWGDFSASFAPGRWFRTGDLGTMRDGQLRISGRRSDLILRGAENVYPAEVENVLDTHPCVAECAVLGVPHPDLGEEVAAIVVVAAGAPGAGAEPVTPDDLAAFARARLGKYKVPSRWLLTTDPLPRNATGKVIRPAAATLLKP